MTTRTKRTGARVRSRRPPSPHLHFYVYTVSGMLGRRRQKFCIVCCHAADARAMIVELCPAIGDLTVTRGNPVHYIAIGDHVLHE